MLRLSKSIGYFTDIKTATTVFLAGKIHRPIMLEGPARRLWPSSILTVEGPLEDSPMFGGDNSVVVARLDNR